MRKLALFLLSVLFLAQLSHADINVTEGSGKVVKTATVGSKEVQIIAIYESSNTVTAVQSGTYTVRGSSFSLASSSGTAVVASTGAYQLIGAPGASNHLRIKYIAASNSGATTTTIGWRDGSTSAARYEMSLPQNGAFAHNLKPDFWELTSNTALTMYSSAAGNVFWMVEYQIVPD